MIRTHVIESSTSRFCGRVGSKFVSPLRGDHDPNDTTQTCAHQSETFMIRYHTYLHLNNASIDVLIVLAYIFSFDSDQKSYTMRKNQLQ